LIAHLHALHDFYGDWAGVRFARKHVGWYVRGQRDASAFRDNFNRARTLQEQQSLIEDNFDGTKMVGDQVT
jgi:tRNA-dihydrouridine synthase B